VVAGITGRRYRRLDHMIGGGEVGLTGTEADHRFTGCLEGLGLGIHGQGGRGSDGSDAV